MFKPIGGEFWYDRTLISDNNEFIDGYFLNGGISSLVCICRYLKSRKIYKILLPNYLCPTILDVFDDESIEYIFYNINYDFSIDINSVKRNIGLVESIMFINYFGLSLKKSEIEYLTSLKSLGKLLIEDNVHSLYSNYIGDISFNSLRKFVAISGSFLQTKLDLNNIINELNANTSYYNQIKKARMEKTEYIHYNKGLEVDYINSYKLAEELYYKEYSLGNNFERKLIVKTDFQKIRNIRNRNYKCLQELLLNIHSLEIIFNSINEKAPLGLPVYIDEDKKSFLVNRLKEKHIYLPIHWRLESENRIKDVTPKNMSSKILTLVIDQRYSKIDMLRLSSEIKKIVG